MSKWWKLSFCQNFIPCWIFSSWIGSLLNSTYVVEKSLSGYCKNFRAAHRESNAHAHFVPEITYNKRTGWWWSCHIRIRKMHTRFHFLEGIIISKKGGLQLLLYYLICWVYNFNRERRKSFFSWLLNEYGSHIGICIRLG